MYLVGDIGNTEIKICLFNSNLKSLRYTNAALALLIRSIYRPIAPVVLPTNSSPAIKSSTRPVGPFMLNTVTDGINGSAIPPDSNTP